MKWFNVKPLASAVLARPILSRLSLSFSLEWGMQLPYQGFFSLVNESEESECFQLCSMIKRFSARNVAILFTS